MNWCSAWPLGSAIYREIPLSGASIPSSAGLMKFLSQATLKNYRFPYPNTGYCILCFSRVPKKQGRSLGYQNSTSPSCWCCTVHHHRLRSELLCHFTETSRGCTCHPELRMYKAGTKQLSRRAQSSTFLHMREPSIWDILSTTSAKSEPVVNILHQALIEKSRLN